MELKRWFTPKNKPLTYKIDGIPVLDLDYKHVHTIEKEWYVDRFGFEIGHRILYKIDGELKELLEEKWYER